MEKNGQAIGRLLTSKNPTAQFFGVVITLVIFLPDVFRVVGDDRLNTWQRLEQIFLAAGQTLVGVALVAISPEVIADSAGKLPEQEKQD